MLAGQQQVRDPPLGSREHESFLQVDGLAHAASLAPENVRDTLGVLLKHRDDIAKLQGGDMTKLLAELQATARGGSEPHAVRAAGAR